VQLSDDEIEELLEFMDVDGDHMVDYHEFVIGTLEDKQMLTEAKLRAAFNFFDSDRNGHIDISEGPPPPIPYPTSSHLHTR